MTTATRNNPALLIEIPDDKSSASFAESILGMSAAAITLGVEIIPASRNKIVQRVQLDSVKDSLKDRPVIVYGSLQFVRDIKDPVFPGAYGYDNTDWQTYSSFIPRGWFLNSDYMMTTWADLADNFEYWSDMIDPTGLFVRPSSGRKIFAAYAISRMFWKSEVNSIRQLSGVLPNTLCVISSIKSVGDEFRFWIVNREVVAETHYLVRGDQYSASVAVPAACRHLAEDVARFEWQPDACYTVDICNPYDDSPKIVELNSFCSAGVYGADTSRILKAVVDQSLRDYLP